MVSRWFRLQSACGVPGQMRWVSDFAFMDHHGIRHVHQQWLAMMDCKIHWTCMQGTSNNVYHWMYGLNRNSILLLVLELSAVESLFLLLFTDGLLPLTSCFPVFVILVLVLDPWWLELAGRPFSEPVLPFIRWINPEYIYIKKKKRKPVHQSLH